MQRLPGSALFALANVLYAPGAIAGSTAIAAMQKHAREAEERWRALADGPFEPECLTIYLSNRCNLACTYCYAAEPNRGAAPPVTVQAVRAAAAYVAASCAANGKPFRVVVHGGGEPTVEWTLLDAIVAATRQAADDAGAKWIGYLATNGVMSASRMREVVEWFDEIGLSCDGPPEIHDRQRPRSSRFVARMARTVLEGGKRLNVRATITPDTIDGQAEIAAYLCATLGARELRFEPVYNVRGPSAFAPDDAERFARNFLEAQRVARKHDASLTLAGVRLGEIHGPHCSALKSALHLVPGDLIAGCFFQAGPAREDALVIGCVEGDGVSIDQERLAAHRARAARVPERCRNCVAVHHCARECPETCMVLDEPSNGFRCRLQKRLAERWILDFAGHAGVFTGRPPLPRPIWARRGFEEFGAAACARLTERVRESGNGSWSVYVHVPFCDRRCAFCDCYSLPLRGRGEPYVRALIGEIETWSRWTNLRRRPVTTIHFGGGTANVLAPDLFERLLNTLRHHLGITERTEWAIESTSTLLTHEHLDQFRSWGFRRLHVGVQTLEQDVRRRIGRRETAVVVLEKLAAALTRGFVTSVDLIYGLPGQTLDGQLATIDRLVEAGVHGFSLYELQRSERNERFLARQPNIDPVDRWLLFEASERRLIGHGYRKNHFTHYARPEDTNLYYGHAVRGEDLLALGASADGVIGGYHYRHNLHDPYVAGDLFEGGVDESPIERQLAPVENALLAGRAPAYKNWIDRGLVNGDGSLTAVGSYLISDMVRELYEMADQ